MKHPRRQPFHERLFDALEYLRRRERLTVFSGAEFSRRVAKAMGRDPFSSAWFTQLKEMEHAPPNETCLGIARVCGVDPGWLTFGAECAAPMVPAEDVAAEEPRAPGRAPAPKLPSTRRTHVDAANEAPPSGRKRA